MTSIYTDTYDFLKIILWRVTNIRIMAQIGNVVSELLSPHAKFPNLGDNFIT